MPIGEERDGIASAIGPVRESFVRDASSLVDPELRELVARSRQTLREVILLWPADQRARLVLWIHRDETGQPQIRARVREQEPGLPNQARAVRRRRGDLLIVFGLGGGRTVVVPWRVLEAAQ